MPKIFLPSNQMTEKKNEKSTIFLNCFPLKIQTENVVLEGKEGKF
jgi:hypothetical protein